jgi:hypothetical protein
LERYFSSSQMHRRAGAHVLISCISAPSRVSDRCSHRAGGRQRAGRWPFGGKHGVHESRGSKTGVDLATRLEGGDRPAHCASWMERLRVRGRRMLGGGLFTSVQLKQILQGPNQCLDLGEGIDQFWPSARPGAPGIRPASRVTALRTGRLWQQVVDLIHQRVGPGSDLRCRRCRPAPSPAKRSAIKEDAGKGHGLSLSSCPESRKRPVPQGLQ